MATPRAEQDLQLWHAWNENRNSDTLKPLLDALRPVMGSEIRKWAQTLPEPFLMARAKQLTIGALKSFDPAKGVQLNTHVTGQLRKVSREVYANQNVARVPENRMLKWHSYRVALGELEDELGRPPTDAELCDRLAWSASFLRDFKQDMGRQEVLESGGSAEGGEGAAQEPVMRQDLFHDMVYHSLTEPQKAVFAGLTGYNNTRVKTPEALQRELRMSPGQFGYLRRQTIDAVRNAQQTQRGIR